MTSGAGESGPGAVGQRAEAGACGGGGPEGGGGAAELGEQVPVLVVRVRERVGGLCAAELGLGARFEQRFCAPRAPPPPQRPASREP